MNFDVKGIWLPDPLYLYWGGGYAYTIGELKNSVNHTRITMHRVFGRGGLRLDFLYFFIKTQGNLEFIVRNRIEDETLGEQINYDEFESGKLFTRKAVKSFNDISSLNNKNIQPTWQLLAGIRF